MVDFKIKDLEDLDFEQVEEYLKELLKERKLRIDKELKEEYKNNFEIEIKLDFNNRTYVEKINKKKYIINISIETYKRIEAFYIHALSENNKESYYPVVGEEKYNDKKAEFYKILLKQLSLEYLIMHEMGHIYNGHLDYKNSEEYTKEDMKMFEWNADDFATHNIIKYYAYKDTINEFNNQKYGKVLKNLKHMLLLIVNSMFTLYSLTDIGKENIPNDETHIKYRIRSFLNAENLFASYGFYNEEVDFDKNWMKYIFIIEDLTNKFLNDVYEINKWDVNNNFEKLKSESLKVLKLNEKYKEELNKKLENYRKVKKGTIIINKGEKMLEKENLEGEVGQEESSDEQNENIESKEAEKIVEEISEEKIQKLEAELKEWKNSYTRKLAEFQNFTKRKETEVSEMKKYASEGIIVKLLENIDNLERAENASAETKNFDALVEGVNMILRNLKYMLSEEGVEEVEAGEGVKFNPYEHQAMMTEEKNDLDNDVIVQVFQKGYKLKGKVIRPAMVTVNKK